MRRICLTFDNGPTKDVTPFVLNELAVRNLPATFFVVGEQLLAPGGIDTMLSVLSAGHIVGNHSMTHSVPLGLSEDPAHVAREIQATEELMSSAGLANDPLLFRPFGGGGKLGPHLLSEDAAKYLIDNRYTVALWNVVPGDWIDAKNWPEKALAEIRAKDDSVVVLHDIKADAMQELPRFLDQLLADGVEFTRDLPASCTPIIEGMPTDALEGCVQST